MLEKDTKKNMQQRCGKTVGLEHRTLWTTVDAWN